MARLIDADALGVGKCNPDVFDDKGYAKGWNSAIEILQNAPTLDAVAVVRCKDCKYSYDDMGGLCCSHGVCVDCVVPEDFFCRYGERKGGGE